MSNDKIADNFESAVSALLDEIVGAAGGYGHRDRSLKLAGALRGVGNTPALHAPGELVFSFVAQLPVIDVRLCRLGEADLSLPDDDEYPPVFVDLRGFVLSHRGGYSTHCGDEGRWSELHLHREGSPPIKLLNEEGESFVFGPPVFL